jgi:hypothetical protein
MKRTKSRAVQQGATTLLQPQQTQSLVVPNGSDAYNGGYYDQQYQQAPADDGEDPMLHPPLWLFILGGVEVAWGGVTNLFQVFTSVTGILGWQQHDLMDSYGYAKAGQLILNRNMGLMLVALVLGVGAQIGIQAFTQQIKKAWKQKRVAEHESTKQALVEIVSELSIGQVIGYASILVCCFSDYLFVTQVDSSGSIGSYVIMTFWALQLAGSSTYILHDGIQRIYSGVLALRAWRLWQDALKAHFEELARQYQQ